MKIKTSELTGAALDWAVGIAQGRKRYDSPCRQADGSIRWTLMFDTGADCKQPFVGCYHPSTDWSQGGPIVEREISRLQDLGDRGWEACGYGSEQTGPTPLSAAMRCYVASKLGDWVEVPDELCT